MIKRLSAAVTAVVLLLAAGALVPAPAPATAPQVAVETVMPVRRDVPVTLAAGARVAPLRMVELRARLASTVRRVHVAEGQFVRAGDLLFSLDDRGERTAVAQARAQVARERALLADLERQQARNRELLARGFVAPSAVDALDSRMGVARAALAAAQAGLAAADVQASHATLRAPMAGRIGAIDVHPGSAIGLDTPLTTITQLHPIAVTFSLPETALADLRAAQERGPVAVTASPGHASPGHASPRHASPGHASLGNAGPALAGTLRFLDAAVDSTTGTIRAKAWFDNRDGRLWPGQYLRATITTRILRGAWVVPQAALGTGADGSFVYTVGSDGAARRVAVTRLHAHGRDAAVAGIDGRDAVVTTGIHNLRPGSRVVAAGRATP